MALTTAERLTVDGVDMKTLCRNVENLSATLSTPPRRGANAQVSGRAGGLWTRKRDDEASYVWEMWILGCDEDGRVPADSNARKEFYSRIDEIVALFGKESSLLDVRHTRADGSVRQAFLECTATLNFTTNSTMAKFNVELTNPSSYWQDVDQSTWTVTAPAGKTLEFGSGATAPLDDSIVIVNGQINDVRIEDLNGNGAFFQYLGSVGNTQGFSLNNADGRVTQIGTLGFNHTNVRSAYMAGRFARFVPHPVDRVYRLRVTGTNQGSNAKVEIQGRRKFRNG